MKTTWMILLLGACATDPTTSNIESALSQGDVVEVPQGFASCRLEHADGEIEIAQPTFAVRLRTTLNGLYCGGTLACDGFQLPFPTPWIKPNSAASCVDPNHCVVDKGPYSFEHALVSGVGGIVAHQFEVRWLQPTSDPKLYTVGPAWFYNGTQDATQLDQMTAITSDPQWTSLYTDVQPHARRCVYVLQQDASGALVYSGFHAQVGQTHDPVAFAP